MEINEKREIFFAKLKNIDSNKIITLENSVPDEISCYQGESDLFWWVSKNQKRVFYVKDRENHFCFGYINSNSWGEFDDNLFIQITSKFDNANSILIRHIYEIYKRWFILEWSPRRINQYCNNIHKKYWNRRIDCQRINRKKTRYERKCIKGNEYNFNKRIK